MSENSRHMQKTPNKQANITGVREMTATEYPTHESAEEEMLRRFEQGIEFEHQLKRALLLLKRSGADYEMLDAVKLAIIRNMPEVNMRIRRVNPSSPGQ